MNKTVLISADDILQWLNANQYTKEIGAKEYALFQAMLKDLIQERKDEGKKAEQ